MEIERDSTHRDQAHLNLQERFHRRLRLRSPQVDDPRSRESQSDVQASKHEDEERPELRRRERSFRTSLRVQRRRQTMDRVELKLELLEHLEDGFR